MASFRLEQGVAIRASDGTRLNADLLRPVGTDPVPALLTLTPYTTSFCWNEAAAFARTGFGVLVVDCRGRGDSEGEFTLYDDGEDGAACVDWLSGQDWCDGAVGLFGGSYSGLNQWQIAARRPEGLRAMAPCVAPMPGFDADWFRGVVPLNDVRWSALVQGRACHIDLYSDEAFWQERYLAHYRSGDGREALANMVAGESPALMPMLEAPVPGPFWAARVPTAEEFAAIDIPVLTITGTADDAQQGALEFRRRHLAARPCADHRLLIGPWTHGGERFPERDPSDPETEATSALAGAERETLNAFFDETLRGRGGDGVAPEPVRVFVAGAEQWRASNVAESAAAEVFHLDAGGTLVPAPVPTEGVVTCAVDAGDYRLGESEANDDAPSLMAVLAGAAALDWHADDRFGRAFTFVSEPLADALEIVGRPELTISLQLDGEDADVAVLLYEWRVDGARTFLSSTHQSLRWRDAEGPGEQWRADRTERIEFRSFRFAARRVRKGSRLAMQFRLLDSIHYQRADALRGAAGAISLSLHVGGAHGGALRIPAQSVATKA